MQFEISDEAAIVFSEFFYDALALGYSVDNALAHARQGVYASGNEVEWATPVLLLRVADGKLFDVGWQKTRTPEQHNSVDLKPPKEPELPPVLAPSPPEPELEPAREPEPEPEPAHRRRWAVACLAVVALAGIVVGAFALGGGGSSDRAATVTTGAPKTPTSSRTSASLPSSDADWPAGKSAWTVVVASETDPKAAQARAEQASSGFDGPTGVLRSDHYKNLRPGYWVAFAGQFVTREQASSATRTLQQAGFADAYPRYVSESG
jgi:hypothetical protein